MSNSNESVYNFKIVLLGEGCVGKTSLVLRYVEDKFNPKHISTLQASFLNKKINVNGKRINLSIWDTAGQERFHALGPIYYRSSNGAILVYDITDEDSFQKVKNWVKELKKMLGTEICLAIAGNKTDLAKDRNVSLEVAELYATGVGAKHYETSAKMNEGIDDLFLKLTNDMIEAYEAKQAQSAALSPSNSMRRSQALVVDDSDDRGDAQLDNNSGNPGRCCSGGTAS
ncbi:ras-related protein Rab-21 [Lutzomyia longipalpis]|uniref:Ras-related protein Rab-21 n=1 Tax=Lutzomyia longipalpis TaxID=7200 RepID=A0A1B0CWU6_LUTLO|nr:ras-related protein Rab-21 [Lutzomyia longipalpis]